jgi:hypothetical protein
MRAGLFPNLLPGKENDENQSKCIVRGEKDTEHPGCQPEGVREVGQRYEDNLFTEES